MPEVTVQGELIVKGTIHGGALNCIRVLYADPADWEMVQFVSQMQLDQYAIEHRLAIIMEQKL